MSLSLLGDMQEPEGQGRPLPRNFAYSASFPQVKMPFLGML
jgi:hypothetical protein